MSKFMREVSQNGMHDPIFHVSKTTAIDKDILKAI